MAQSKDVTRDEIETFVEALDNYLDAAVRWRREGTYLLPGSVERKRVRETMQKARQKKT